MSKTLLFLALNLFVVSICAQTASCQNINVVLDETGNVTITAADVNSGSSVGNLSIDISNFTCVNLGTNIVVLTATDPGNPGSIDTCEAVVTVSPPEEPTPENCWDSYQFDSGTCSWENQGFEPIEPTVECWETATFNDAICDWEVSGDLPEEPTPDNCWDSYQFNTGSCSWENQGFEPIEPTVECWETATFNDAICDWEVSGDLPEEPTPDNCWDSYQFDSGTCSWENQGFEPTEPFIECWETATFNDAICDWEVSGDQPEEPTPENCWDDYQFNTGSCSWENQGFEPIEPTVECWETATFNDAICDWEVSGDQPEEPTPENCWDSYQFNTGSCSWENQGFEPIEPTVECWETATFNDSICDWEVSGDQPEEPTPDNCWDDYQFNTGSCSWENQGFEPIEPTVECWETATFNDSICDWEVSGDQPEEPTPDNCWDDYQFNTGSCSWENIGNPIIYYIDADGDTYGSMVTAMLCDLTAPPGYSVNNLDCNDSDVNINPGVTEIPGNNIDDDCNPATADGILGIDDFNFNIENILIASNPFDNIIAIELPSGFNNSEFNIKIFDLNGRLVFDKNHSSINGKINISNLNRLKQASYLIKITDIESGSSIINKLMKH